MNECAKRNEGKSRKGHVESPLGLVTEPWDHELGAGPRRKDSADKSDARQTLRAVRRRSAVAKRLECVGLQHRFPKADFDSMEGQGT